jgi:large subunit ribosomal protein L13
MSRKQNSFSQRKEDVVRAWHLFDVKGKVLGRVATEIAIKLMGKEKAEFTPHIDAGDFVVVTNASLVEVTRNKAEDKIYYSHSGFPGGLKQINFKKLQEKNPQEIIRRAVKNMLPKNKHRDLRMARLKIYVDENHKHQSQLKGKDGN